MHRYLFNYPLKPLVFPKQPLPHTGDTLKSPLMLRDVWLNDETTECECDSSMEAWPDASYGREKSLR